MFRQAVFTRGHFITQQPHVTGLASAVVKGHIHYIHK